MDEANYVRLQGVLCPDCWSSNIEGDGSVEIEGSDAWEAITCNACGARWTDQYTLIGYEELEHGDPERLGIKRAWELFSNTAINDDDEIQDNFFQFEKRTPRFEVWTWFEETFGVPVAQLLFPKQND